MGRNGGDQKPKEKKWKKRGQNNCIWIKQYGPDTNLWHPILKLCFELSNHCDPRETIGFKVT